MSVSRRLPLHRFRARSLQSLTLNRSFSTTPSVDKNQDSKEKKEKKDEEKKPAWKFKTFATFAGIGGAYYWHRKTQREAACEELKNTFVGPDEKEIKTMTKKAKLTPEDILAAAKELVSLGQGALPVDQFGTFVSEGVMLAKQKRYQEYLQEKIEDEKEQAERRKNRVSNGELNDDDDEDDEEEYELVFEEDLTERFGIWETLCFFRHTPLINGKVSMSDLLTSFSALAYDEDLRSTDMNPVGRSLSNPINPSYHDHLCINP